MILVHGTPWSSPFFKHVEMHEEAFSGVPDYIHGEIVEAYIKTAVHQPLSQETIQGILTPWQGTDGKAAFYRQIAQDDSKFTDDIHDKFKEIKNPVLILWGEEDNWIPSEKAYSLQQKITNSSLVTIPNTGHLVVEEEPVTLSQLMIDFIHQ